MSGGWRIESEPHYPCMCSRVFFPARASASNGISKNARRHSNFIPVAIEAQKIPFNVAGAHADGLIPRFLTTRFNHSKSFGESLKALHLQFTFRYAYLACFAIDLKEDGNKATLETRVARRSRSALVPSPGQVKCTYRVVYY